MTGVVLYRTHANCAGESLSISKYVVGWQQLVENRVAAGGTPGAPITIIEFSDYECPFCVAMQNELRLLLDSHPGKLAIYRYAITVGPSVHGHRAAIASKCAEIHGLPDTYQSELFKHSAHLSNLDYTALAHQVGTVDPDAFEQCLHNDQTHAYVNMDKQIAENLEINSTPTLVINGNIIVGFMSFSELNSLIGQISVDTL